MPKQRREGQDLDLPQVRYPYWCWGNVGKAKSILMLSDDFLVASLRPMPSEEIRKNQEEMLGITWITPKELKEADRLVQRKAKKKQ